MNNLYTIIKTIFLSTVITIGALSSVNAQIGCTLACTAEITAALSHNGTASIWPQVFLKGATNCTGTTNLTIEDEAGNLIFDQSSATHWKVDTNHVNQTFNFTIKESDSENICWGKIHIVENDHTPNDEGLSSGNQLCGEIPVDFSHFTMSKTLLFESQPLSAIQQELRLGVKTAFESMIDTNITATGSNDFVVGWSTTDAISERDNNEIFIEREIVMIDWCSYDPISGQEGVFTFNQEITIKDLQSIAVVGITAADDNETISVNKILITKDKSQDAIPQLDSEQNLFSSLKASFEELEWNEGTIDLNIEKYDTYNRGVSSIDLVKVVQHIIGTRSLTTNAAQVAADFDENGSISVLDLVKMKNVIIGRHQESNDSGWRFYKDQLLETKDYNNSLLSQYKLEYNIANLDDTNNGIVAIKLGDVNNTAQNKKSNSRSISNQFIIEDIDLKTNQNYVIPIKSIDDMDMISADLNLISNDNFEIIGFTSEFLDISENNYYINNNSSKLVWYKADKISLAKNSSVFSVIIKSNVSGRLSDVFDASSTELYIYNSSNQDDPQVSKFVFDSKNENFENSNSELKIYASNGTIKIQTGKNIINRIELFDISGRTLPFSNDRIGENNYILEPNHYIQGIVGYRLLDHSGIVTTGKLFLN